jgi:hypothetical protein
MRTGVIFMVSMLSGVAGLGIGKNGHRSLAGELVEIADEVGLVEVFGFKGDVGPVRATGAVGEIGRAHV